MLPFTIHTPYLQLTAVNLLKLEIHPNIYKLMLFREIVAVYSQTHMKNKKPLCEQITEFLNVKASGT
jgi:hypothetical protein